MTSFLIGGMSFSQFQIGHTTVTYNDATRTGGFGSGGGSGRQIQCEIYYPATAAGDNTPIEINEFPIITFGHGFAMGWDAYSNIWEHLVPKGYILIFPRTEGGLFPGPSHLDFGKDLVVVTNRFIQDCTSSGNFFQNRYNGKNAVMGHSMGGGASFLAAAESNAPFNVLVGLAPAETSPLASTAAASVTIPALVLSGSSDAVTPPADHHQLIYDNLPTSSCLNFVTITGGAHCYFANTNFNCDFGESSSGGTITINRAEQQDILFDVIDPYLAFYLKHECSEWTTFQNELTTDSRIVVQDDCSYELPVANQITAVGTTLSTTIPNPSLTLHWYFDGDSIPGATNTSFIISSSVSGNYTAVFTDEFGCQAISDPYAYNSGTNSISENSNVSISFYPNPTTGIITILNTGTENEAQLVSIDGKIIQTFLLKNNAQINLSKLNSGVYFIQTETTTHIINKQN
jgi:Secretion system C-terminal sorting domain/Chlorophyllase